MKNTMIKTLLHTLLIGICLLSLNTQAGVEITYIHNDALGTPVAGTDEQGNVKWRAHYQPYGEELLGERQLFGVRTGYTGHRDDPETGLTYMGARYYSHYSPTIGRFMGVDPTGVDESNIHSFNRYAYANNNPYKFVDPNGENPKLFIDFALNVALNIAITGKPQLLSAVRETVRGALNPLKTLRTAGKLAKVLTKKSLLGKNAKIKNDRTLTDLKPVNDRATAKSIFRNQTKGQRVEQFRDDKTGSIRRRSDDGTQIRMKSDGSTSVDLPGRGTQPNGETIHFNR